MNARIGIAFVVLMALLAGQTLQAHHNIATLFDWSKKITLTGTLTKIDWRNPHSEFQVEAKNARGEPEAWVLQAPSLSSSGWRGASRSDLDNAVGKTVTVEIHRARNGTLWGALMKITVAEGKEPITVNPTR
jgi:hypothetical protein